MPHQETVDDPARAEAQIHFATPPSQDGTFQVRTLLVTDNYGSTEFAVPDINPASKLFPAVLAGSWVNDTVGIAIFCRSANGELFPHKASIATAIAKVTKEDARLLAHELLRIADADSADSGEAPARNGAPEGG